MLFRILLPSIAYNILNTKRRVIEMKKIIIIITLISSIFASGCAVIEDAWGALDVFNEVDTFNDPKLIQREESIEKNGEKLVEKINKNIELGDFKNAESFIDTNLENYSKEENKEYWRIFSEKLIEDYFTNQADYEKLIEFLLEKEATDKNYEELILYSKDAPLIAIYQRMLDSHHMISFGLGESVASESLRVIPDLDYYITKYEDKMDEEFLLNLKATRYFFIPVFNEKEKKFDLPMLVDSVLVNSEYMDKYPDSGSDYNILFTEFDALLGLSAYPCVFNHDGSMVEGADKEFKRLIDNIYNKDAKSLLTDAWKLIESNEFKNSTDLGIKLTEIRDKLIAL